MSSAIAYHPSLDLIHHRRETFTIYSLINPFTETPFYVGKTSMGLNSRLSGHLWQKTGGNKPKIDYIASIMSQGERPRIVELEVINGICRLDKIYAAHREIHWIKYYKSQGIKLFNVIGMQENAEAAEYSVYLECIKNKKFVSNYYYCGKTIEGYEVYDEKRINLDGFEVVWVSEEPPTEPPKIEPGVPLSNYIPYIKDELDALGSIPSWINTEELKKLLPQPDWSYEFASGMPPDEFLLDLQMEDDLDFDECDCEPDDWEENIEESDDSIVEQIPEIQMNQFWWEANENKKIS